MENLPIMTIKRGDIVWVALDPIKGREQQETRPCIVVSANELNAFSRMLVGVPRISRPFPYPRAIPISSTPKKSYALIEQMQSTDASVGVIRVEGRVSVQELDSLCSLIG